MLRAAHQIPESVGVVTIGSPADAEHVVKQFSGNLDQIAQSGEAEVDLAGRKFTIKKQFLNDALDQSNTPVSALKKALLIFHSPSDKIVSIKEAEKIYQQARHPKSFVSLDDADHLLTKKQDADYVAEIISAWASRFIDDPPTTVVDESGVERGAVLVEERNHQFAQNIISDHHFWLADEPLDAGGTNLGPDPYEILLAALGSCTAMTVRMYANRKQWPLEEVNVVLSHARRHAEDCQQCDAQHSQIAKITRTITLKGPLSDEQRQRLLEISVRCPVHKTLHNKIVIETTLG